MSQVNYFLYKKFYKKLNLKVLGFSTKLYPKVLGLATTSDPRVIFIILIITLNLHDPSLSGFGCNTRSNNIGCGSSCKVVS
jgi:hypothetical protein